jgi:hypothetical protein
MPALSATESCALRGKGLKGAELAATDGEPRSVSDGHAVSLKLLQRQPKVSKKANGPPLFCMLSNSSKSVGPRLARRLMGFVC